MIDASFLTTGNPTRENASVFQPQLIANCDARVILVDIVS